MLVRSEIGGLAFLLSVIVGANDGGSKIAALILFVALCAVGRKLTRKDANIFLVLNQVRKRKALYNPAKREWFRFSIDAPTLLVRSREGGLVLRNCLQCGKPEYVSEDQLPKLDCEFCGDQLLVQKLDGYNYFYVSRRCKRDWQLSRFLPHWSELFEHCGLLAPYDVPR